MVRKNGEPTYLAVTGGFMEVMGNKVTILADACERSDEIDEARAQAAVQRAREQLSRRGATLEMERALQAVRRAEVRLNVVRRRRGREQPGIHPGGGQAGAAH
jgi:F-type H+-transporting ATPase subunit epsilon